MCVRLADMNAVDMYGVSAMHLAAENGHIHSLRVLLNGGAACNIGTAQKRPQWITATGCTILSSSRLPYRNTACINKCAAYSVNTGVVPIR